MYATIVAFLVALIIWFSSPAGLFNNNNLPLLISAMAILLFLTLAIIRSVNLGSLQEERRLSSSRVGELWKKDLILNTVGIWTTVFVIVSIACSIHLASMPSHWGPWSLGLWVLLLGVTLDSIRIFNQRVQQYLNPFETIKLIVQSAKESAVHEKETEFCDWIDALTEITLKAIRDDNLSLASDSLDGTQQAAADLLDISRASSLQHADAKSSIERVSFILFYLFQRLDLIDTKAIEKNFETLCSQLVSVLGKIAINAAKYDLSLSAYPMHFLAKLAKRAQENKFPDIAIKTSLMYVEIASAIANDPNAAYLEIKTPLLNITGHLEEIAKETFRLDKTIDIKILTQPFINLKAALLSSKASLHQDIPPVTLDIDRIIGEFDTLDVVMKTMPPIPEIVEKVNREINPT